LSRRYKTSEGNGWNDNLSLCLVDFLHTVGAGHDDAEYPVVAVMQFVDLGFLDCYRKAEERNNEYSRPQEKRNEHALQDKTETHDHKTKLVGAPEQVEPSKSAIERAENSHLAQQVSTIEQVRELVAVMLLMFELMAA